MCYDKIRMNYRKLFREGGKCTELAEGSVHGQPDGMNGVEFSGCIIKELVRVEVY
jgi:hypothetical protein